MLFSEEAPVNSAINMSDHFRKGTKRSFRIMLVMIQVISSSPNDRELFCQALTDLLDEGVILIFAIQQRGGKGTKSFCFCHLSSGLQSAVVTVSASFVLTIDHASKKSLKIIFIPVDHLQSGSAGVVLNSLLSPDIFLIRVDVGIVKKPKGLKSRFP